MSKVDRVLNFIFPQTDEEFLRLAEGHPDFISEAYGNYLDAEELIEEIKQGANALDPQQFKHCEELVSKISRNYAFFEKSFNEVLTLSHSQVDVPTDGNPYATSHDSIDSNPFPNALANESVAKIVDVRNSAGEKKMKNLYRLLGAMSCLAGVGLQTWANNNGVGRDSFLEISEGGQHVKLKRREIMRRVQELVRFSELEEGHIGLGKSTIMTVIQRALVENPEFETQALEELRKIFADTY